MIAALGMMSMTSITTHASDQPKVTIAHCPIAIHTAITAIGDRRPVGLEGVWMLTDDQTSIIIVRDNPMTYSVLAGRAHDLSIKPGTIIGTLTLSGKEGLYDMKIARTFKKDGTPSRYAHMAVKVDGTGDIIHFISYRHGIRVDLRRLIPYMFRVSVSSTDTRPEGLNGAHRIWPPPEPTFDNPVVL